MPLDPDIAAFLAQTDPNGFDALLPMTDSGEDLSHALGVLRALPRRPIPADDTLTVHDDTTADGVRLRLYRLPGAEAQMPVVLFMHGGGWVLGDLDTHDHLCRWIARAGLLVVSVDYRLAPENPFPAPLNDLDSALLWIVDHAERLGGDSTSVVATGTSSGANLAAALTLRETLKGSHRIAAQMLAYPAIDSRMSTQSFVDNATGYHLTARQMAWFWDQYVSTDRDRTDPLASPAHATSLVGCPPTLVLTAEFDVLRDEGEEFARRLAADGVHVEHVRAEGMIHGFLAMADVFPAAAPTLDWTIAAMQRLVTTSKAGR